MGRSDGVVTRTLSSLTALEFVTIPFTELFSLCITVFMFYAKTDVSVEYIWSLQFRLHQITCIVAYWPYKKPKYKNRNVELSLLMKVIYQTSSFIQRLNRFRMDCHLTIMHWCLPWSLDFRKGLPLPLTGGKRWFTNTTEYSRQNCYCCAGSRRSQTTN